MTVTLGVDPHKASHTVVATDPVGRQLAQTTSRGTRTSDHQKLIGWAGQRWPERTWAVEDCRHVAGRLLADLLAAGERVVLVPPRLMAQVRQASRVRASRTRSTPWRWLGRRWPNPGCPRPAWMGRLGSFKLLVGHREDLVAERTRIENRLRWHVHDLDPERAAMLPCRHLEQRRVLDELEAWLAELPDSVQVGIVGELVGRCRELTLRANELQAELGHRVARVCPRLLGLPGCGVLTAAKIVAEVAGVGRFRSEAALAMHAGVAPLECSSGAWQRHRLSRVGNRQLNAALHRIAVTQLRVHPPAQAYLTRLEAAGKSKREGLRVLKRRLVRVVFNLLHADLDQAQLAPIGRPLADPGTSRSARSTGYPQPRRRPARARQPEEAMGRPSVRIWLLLCLVAIAGCNGPTPPRATPTTTTIVSTSTAAPADTPAEQTLQLTHSLPRPYRDACQQLLAYAPVGAAGCPPLVPQGPLQVHAAGPIAPSDGYEQSYVLDLASGSLDTIRGRSVDTNGGHWTISAARGPTARKVLAEQLHAALGSRRARCRHLRLDGEPVEACQVPTTDDGYYSGHIAYAWEHRGVVYHITIHGHANQPRVALMMAAFIKQVRGR